VYRPFKQKTGGKQKTSFAMAVLAGTNRLFPKTDSQKSTAADADNLATKNQV